MAMPKDLAQGPRQAMAKALHTDFGQHDFHPDESHDDEEETEVEEGGGGEAAVTGGDGPVDVVSPERRRCIVM